jgi:predicted ATPase/DNA-binding CsgD family transcriptional regulator
LEAHATRLLTLTGAGGVGKTRLALRLASKCQSAFQDGVWLVALEALGDPALVPQTLAEVVGVEEEAGRPLMATLAGALQRQRALLLLDNCEHLLDACARLTDTLLRACPQLTILATSREPLGVPGEVTWRVPPLAVPEASHSAAVEALAPVESVALFVERARAALPSFRLTAQNAGTVATICRRLDGIPLALELAAARVRALAPDELLARLDDLFQVLTGGSRTALPRQQTLRAAVDWSYSLLTEAEQRLFRRLAVFASGFTLAGAETVCAGDPVEARDVLALVTSLVDKSLVVAENRGAGQRYRLLETMRQYAEDRLRQAGEDTALRDRHLDWCVALAHGASESERSRDTARFHEALKRYNAEADNVRAALVWGASTPDGASRALNVLASIILAPRPTQAETVRWLETLLDAAPARTRLRASALLRLDHLKRLRHDFAGARVAVEEARAIAGEIGDEELATTAAARSALVAANLGEYASAVAALERCLGRARERGNWTWVEGFARDLGGIAIAMGDLPRARAALAESRDAGIAHGSRYTVRPRLFLTIVDRLSGNLRAARTALEALCAEVGAWNAERSQFDRFLFHEPARWALANMARDEGRFDEARRLLVQSLDDLLRQGEVGQLSNPTCMAGLLDMAAGRLARGVTVVAACAPPAGPIGTVHVPEVRLEAPLFLERARAALGHASYEAAWAHGQSMTHREAVELALAESAAPPNARQPVPGALSSREMQVVKLVARGLTNREIAAELVVTEHTAMRHVEHILSKLSLRNRTQVTAWAVAHGVADGTPTG